VASAGAGTHQVTAPAGLVLAAARAQGGQCMVASGVVEACELCGESELSARCCAGEICAGVSAQAAQLTAPRAVAVARVAMDTRAAEDLRRVSEAASRVLATRSGDATLAHESCYWRGWRRTRGRVGRRCVRRGTRRRKLGLTVMGYRVEVLVHGVGGVASGALFVLRVRDG
jgi:hypothetical protein